MANCSHCGKEARSDEQFCHYCGRDLLAESAAISAEPEAIYAASGAPLSWNSSQPQMSDSSANGNIAQMGAANAPQARLVVSPSPTAEPGAVVDDGEREFLLDGRDIAVGRAPSCDIVLAGDQLASRRHALLRLRDDTYTVVDLGSSNGTYVNDEEIHAETPLKDGDRVTVGGHDLLFSTAPASSEASIAGTLPVQPMNSTLLETAPIAIVNVPAAAPAAPATPYMWQPQQQQDAPLAEPEQLGDAGEPMAEDDYAPDHTVMEYEQSADEFVNTDATEAGAAPADEAAPAADESISQADTAYWAAPEEAAAAPDEAATPEVSMTDSASAESDSVESAPATEMPSATDSAPAEPATVDASSADVASASSAVAAATDGASATDLDDLRSQLAEISTALSRKADEEYKLAGRLRAALVEVRDSLASLEREHGSGSYTSSEPQQDYDRLATIARQAADHPRHLDYLSSLSDASGEIAEALESKQAAATNGGDNDLLSGVEALRARLDETLG